MIGIVGGVGPYAGLDLAKNIFDNTIADTDQDHLDLLMLSVPQTITDRTEYLMGRDETNPGAAIARVLMRMEKAGATVAGIPCNTAHAEGIFGVIEKALEHAGAKIMLINMAQETVKAIREEYPAVKNVAVLSTTGTYKFGIYAKPLKEEKLKIFVPGFETQDNVVHAAIYNREYGIKAKANPVTDRARSDLLDVARQLVDQGAELIIKGCTEIVLAIPEDKIYGVPTIDPSVVLARRLVEIECPEKLKWRDKR